LKRSSKSPYAAEGDCSRSSAGAASCSLSTPSWSSKRPEHVTHWPVDRLPSTFSVFSRGGFPEPRHLPTSGIVIAVGHTAVESGQNPFAVSDVRPRVHSAHDNKPAHRRDPAARAAATTAAARPAWTAGAGPPASSNSPGTGRRSAAAPASRTAGPDATTARAPRASAVRGTRSSRAAPALVEDAREFPCFVLEARGSSRSTLHKVLCVDPPVEQDARGVPALASATRASPGRRLGRQTLLELFAQAGLLRTEATHYGALRFCPSWRDQAAASRAIDRPKSSTCPRRILEDHAAAPTSVQD
jgi:hypothetical protein